MLPATTRRDQRIPVYSRRRTPPKPPAFLLTQDEDYVATFRTAAYVNRLVELRGATTGRLLRRSSLYHALGDYVQSMQDAAAIVRSDPKSSEGQFRLGAATMALAIQRLHHLPSGPGATRKTNDQDPEELLLAARDAFLRAHQLNAADREAKDAVRAAERYLDSLGRPPTKTEKARKGLRCRV